MREYPIRLVRKGNQIHFEERKLDRCRLENVAGYLGWLREKYPDDYQMLVTLNNNGESLVYPEV
jgi:hypothetical protein